MLSIVAADAVAILSKTLDNEGWDCLRYCYKLNPPPRNLIIRATVFCRADVDPKLSESESRNPRAPGEPLQRLSICYPGTWSLGRDWVQVWILPIVSIVVPFLV